MNFNKEEVLYRRRWGTLAKQLFSLKFKDPVKATI